MTHSSLKTTPNSAVSPWNLILQGRHQDKVCTGLLGSCPGCPCQGRWWANSSHITGLTIVSEYPRCPCHCIPDMASTSTPLHTKTLFGFSGKDFLAFVLPAACLRYANTITHMVWALTCFPPPSILTVLEQYVATVCDFWCSERATEHWKFHWEQHRRRYYYLHRGTSNLTLVI